VLYGTLPALFQCFFRKTLTWYTS